MALGAGLTAWWTASDLVPITGDEPHYLIIAASLLRDGDLDVRNNYEHNARTREISVRSGRMPGGVETACVRFTRRDWDCCSRFRSVSAG